MVALVVNPVYSSDFESPPPPPLSQATAKKMADTQMINASTLDSLGGVVMVAS
jgi:hypothetical protein